MNNRRLKYVDIAKGLGIFLVVLGHVYRKNIVQNWLYSFHMPLFFFISGWLYNVKDNHREKFVNFFEKKVRRLFIPYIVFLMLNFFYWLVVERHFRSFDQGPLWYLPILIIVECAVLLIVKWTNNEKRKSNICLLILIIGFLCIGNIVGGGQFQFASSIIEWMIRCYNGILWYYIGYWLAIFFRKQVEEIIPTSKWAIMIIGVFFCLNMFLGISNGRVDMYGNIFNNIYLYILAAFFGILFCMGISIIIGHNEVFEYLGKNSLIIMCTHEPIKRIVIQIISIILCDSSEIIRNNILLGLIISIFVLLLEILVIKMFSFLNKITEKKKIYILFKYIK